MIKARSDSRDEQDGGGILAHLSSWGMVLGIIIVSVIGVVHVIEMFGNVDAETPAQRWQQAVDGDCQTGYTEGDFTYDPTDDAQLQQCDHYRFWGGDELEFARMGMSAWGMIKIVIIAVGFVFVGIGAVGRLRAAPQAAI